MIVGLKDEGQEAMMALEMVVSGISTLASDRRSMRLFTWSRCSLVKDGGMGKPRGLGSGYRWGQGVGFEILTPRPH